MRKTTKPGKRPRALPLTPHDLPRVTAGKEDAGIHVRAIGGGGDQPLET